MLRDVEFFDLADSFLMQNILRHRVQDIKAVAPYVDVASLGAVVSGNGPLHDTQPLQLELD